jgi:hypothetical protein
LRRLDFPADDSPVKYRKNESLTEAQNGKKNENVAGSVLLSLVMDGTVMCKLPSMLCSTDLSRIQHLNMKWQNLEFRNIRKCVHTVVIMEPSM